MWTLAYGHHRESHAELRLRADARGRDRRVRQELAVGVGASRPPRPLGAGGPPGKAPGFRGGPRCAAGLPQVEPASHGCFLGRPHVRFRRGQTLVRGSVGEAAQFCSVDIHPRRRESEIFQKEKPRRDGQGEVASPVTVASAVGSAPAAAPDSAPAPMPKGPLHLTDDQLRRRVARRRALGGRRPGCLPAGRGRGPGQELGDGDGV
jgi:hypothetical protein